MICKQTVYNATLPQYFVSGFRVYISHCLHSSPHAEIEISEGSAAPGGGGSRSAPPRGTSILLDATRACLSEKCDSVSNRYRLVQQLSFSHVLSQELFSSPDCGVSRCAHA